MSEGSPDFEPVQPTTSEKKPEREGLPSGYRMRADAHYVDQLTGRRGERVYSDQPRVTTPFDTDAAAEPVQRERRDVRERRSDRVLAQIAEEVSAIEAAAALWRSQGSSQRRLGADLLQVHTGRAAWLTGANTLLDGSPRGAVATRSIGALLMQVREGLATECRMAGVVLRVEVDNWDARVVVQENEFKFGVAGAIRALLAALPEVELATIRVSATVADDTVQVIEVSQDLIQVPAMASHRFFDLSWTDRPGGWLAAFAASVARAFVQGGGGSASFVPGDRRGGTIRLVLTPTN